MQYIVIDLIQKLINLSLSANKWIDGRGWIYRKVPRNCYNCNSDPEKAYVYKEILLTAGLYKHSSNLTDKSI